MREGWKEVKLGEILEIKHGYGFKGEYFTDEKTEDILVTPGNFHIGGGFKGDKLKFYKGPVNENFVLKENDVVVTMTDLSKMADTIGFSAKIPAKSDQRYLHNQRIGLVSLLDESFDLNFIYWLLRTNSYQRYIAGSAIGATVKHTSPSKIYTAKVIVPENKETQRKIASILSGYDDLIENNLKRIKILEEMAQQTYEEWFVRMRFPGYESAVINKETGLPEGWEKVKLNEIADFQNGYAFYTKGYSEKGYAIIDLGNVSEYGDLNISGNEKLISTELYHSLPKFHLKKHDIVIAMTDITSSLRILAKSAIIDKDDTYALNQRVGMLRPKTGLFNFAFLYALLSDYRFIERMKAMSKGAVQFYFNTKDIVNYETFLPPKDIIDDFVNVYEPYLNTRMLLKDQNQRLRETRDLLLPRLMMGILEV